MNYKHEDGTPFTKEEFLQRLKTDKEFNDEFGNKGIDQISELIKQIKENPDSRRLIVSAWAVHDLPNMVLPPCHYGFQVYTRELSVGERYEIQCKKENVRNDWEQFYSTFGGYKYEIDLLKKMLDDANIPQRAISLMWNQRSVDTFLGLPFNIASYGLLLEIIAKTVNMVPDELICNLGDTHLYNNHIDQAKELITRTPYDLPTLKHMKTDAFYSSLSESTTLFGHLDNTDFVIENYQSHSAIKAPLSN